MRRTIGIIMIVVGFVLFILSSFLTQLGFIALLGGAFHIAFFLLIPWISAILLIYFGSRLRKRKSYSKLKCTNCKFKMDGTLLFCPKCGESTRSS